MLNYACAGLDNRPTKLPQLSSRIAPTWNARWHSACIRRATNNAPELNSMYTHTHTHIRNYSIFQLVINAHNTTCVPYTIFCSKKIVYGTHFLKHRNTPLKTMPGTTIYGQYINIFRFHAPQPECVRFMQNTGKRQRKRNRTERHTKRHTRVFVRALNDKNAARTTATCANLNKKRCERDERFVPTERA